MERPEYVKWLLDEIERQENTFFKRTVDRVGGSFAECDLRNDLKLRVQAQLNLIEKEMGGADDE